MPLTPDQVGQMFAERRKQLGEKQSTIAARAGLSNTVVSDLEHGRRLEGLRPFLRLADALEVNLRFEAREGGGSLAVRDKLSPILGTLIDEADDDDREWLEQFLLVGQRMLEERKRSRPLSRRSPRAYVRSQVKRGQLTGLTSSRKLPARGRG